MYYIDGLGQERHNSTAKVLKFIYLALTLQYIIQLCQLQCEQWYTDTNPIIRKTFHLAMKNSWTYTNLMDRENKYDQNQYCRILIF